MDKREKVREALRIAEVESWMSRQASDFPGGETTPGLPGVGKRPDLQSGNATRQIPKNHKFDPKSLKPMARMLWAMSVSMGHALQAYRTFNRIKSSTVSPDGMLGGRGYVMKVTEMRQKLYDACEALSAISDTIHDEINAPHWKPKLAELDQSEIDSIDRLIGESEENLDNPEEDAEEGEEEAEKSGTPSDNWPPKSWGKGKKDRAESASDLPGGGDSEVVQRPSSKPKRKKDASVGDPIRVAVARAMQANSSLPVETLPGPRIQHLDPADTDQRGPGGSVNTDPVSPNADDWTLDGEFPSDWENETLGISASVLPQDGQWHVLEAKFNGETLEMAVDGKPVSASAALPTDTTPSEGLDFGLGWNDPADGEGLAGNVPQGGPESGLPDDPGGKMHDNEGDFTPTIENHLNERAKRAMQRLFSGFSRVPNDNEEGVARSDYFDGPKPDNQMNTVRAEAALPGDGTEARDEQDRDLMNTGYRYERPGQPRAEWDNTKR